MRLFKALLILIITLPTFGQDNDTSLLRANSIAKVEKYILVHAFERKQDLCLYQTYKIDNKGRTLFEKTNLRCFGYTTFEETDFNYLDDRLTEIMVSRDNLPFSTIKYAYEDGQELPTDIKTFFPQTNDSVSMNYNYYNKNDKLDSTEITEINQLGVVTKTKSFARYDKYGNIIQLITADDKRYPLEEVSYEYNSDTTLASMAFTKYGEEASFSQTFYEYNQHRQVATTVNNINQKQEFIYFPNGLVRNILNYNPKGELESEYIFKYLKR